MVSGELVLHSGNQIVESKWPNHSCYLVLVVVLLPVSACRLLVRCCCSVYQQGFWKQWHRDNRGEDDTRHQTPADIHSGEFRYSGNAAFNCTQGKCAFHLSPVVTTFREASDKMSERGTANVAVCKTRPRLWISVMVSRQTTSFVTVVMAAEITYSVLNPVKKKKKLNSYSRCIRPDSRRQPCSQRAGRPAAGWRPSRCSTPLRRKRNASLMSTNWTKMQKKGFLLCLFESHGSRWGGSSSRAGCCRWFPADTWSSLVAQNKDSWRTKGGEKKSLLFSCDYKESQVQTAPPCFTLHIFHRISFWVFRFGGFKWEHASKKSLNTHEEPKSRKIICVWKMELQNDAFYESTMLFKKGHSHTKRWILSIL